MIDALVVYIESKGFTVQVQPGLLLISKYFQGEFIWALFVPTEPWPTVLSQADYPMWLITESIKERQKRVASQYSDSGLGYLK